MGLSELLHKYREIIILIVDIAGLIMSMFSTFHSNILFLILFIFGLFTVLLGIFVIVHKIKKLIIIVFGFFIIMSVILLFFTPSQTTLDLTAYPGHHVKFGEVLSLNANASNSNNNDKEFRFLLDGHEVQGWSSTNFWEWRTKHSEAGHHVITCEARIPFIGKTEATGRIECEILDPPAQITDLTASSSNDPPNWGAVITWNAIASGEDGDEVYRFLLDNMEVQSWSSSKSWKWSTKHSDVGKHTISVEVKDNHDDKPDSQASKDYEIYDPPAQITSLMADPNKNPQDYGSIIRWKAEAFDTDGDTLFYRFLQKGIVKKDWSNDNTWDWETNHSDVGMNDISCEVRDDNSNNAQDSENRNFRISDVAPILEELISDSPENKCSSGSEIEWRVNAYDPDPTDIEYQFWLKGPATGNNWKVMKNWCSDPVWKWKTSSSDVGHNFIKAVVQDKSKDVPGSSNNIKEYVVSYCIGDTCANS